MRYQDAVLRHARPAPPFWEVSFDVALPPQAGQFVLADFGAPIRDALYPCRLDADGFTTILPPGHPALRLLPGTPVSLLGPSGHGFSVTAQRLLLVAETPYLPYLMPLLSGAPSVVLVVEAQTRAGLPQLTQFDPHVELVLVTLDSSAGYAGPLESAASARPGQESVAGRLSELLTWTDCVCLALQVSRYPRFAEWVRRIRLVPHAGFAQAWVRAEMPCGVGACDVCRVMTRYGEKRICVDGPVLNLLDFDLSAV